MKKTRPSPPRGSVRDRVEIAFEFAESADMVLQARLALGDFETIDRQELVARETFLQVQEQENKDLYLRLRAAEAVNNATGHAYALEAIEYQTFLMECMVGMLEKITE